MKRGLFFWWMKLFNLVNRARSMYSCELNRGRHFLRQPTISKATQPLHAALRANKPYSHDLKSSAKRKDGNFIHQRDPISSIRQRLADVIEQMDVYLQSEHEDTWMKNCAILYFSAHKLQPVPGFMVRILSPVMKAEQVISY